MKTVKHLLHYNFFHHSTFRSVFVLFVIFLSTSSAQSQWRIATPRDTVFVPANQSIFSHGKLPGLTPGVDMWLSTSNVFSISDGTSTFGIDAAYTYLVGGASLFPQALNPPTYGGKTHKYELTVTTIPGLNETKFVPIENSYQLNHVYTAHIPCQGNTLQFRILADKNADYATASGGININMARWTAGIAIKNTYVDFPNVSIGTSSIALDSLASYGLDPLQVDSIKIIDISGNGDFTFLTKNNSFTLPTEQAAEIKITYSPSIRGDETAEIHIYCHNADPASREKVIALHGFGVAPSFGVGPHQIDFGKVRINYPKTGFTNVSNDSGNTTLHVTASSHYNQIQPIPPPDVFSFGFPSPPMDITAHSIGQIRTIFSPTKRVNYEGWLQVRANNVPADSVHLIGEGAEPVPVWTPVPKNGVLNFGTVYRGDTKTDTITLTNKGNWTCSGIYVHLYGGAVFSYSPADPNFIVEPDSSRKFMISFHPGTGRDSLNFNGVFVVVYDDYSIDSILLKGTEIEADVIDCNNKYDFGKVRVNIGRTDTVSCLINEKGNSYVALQREDILSADTVFQEIGRIVGLDAHTSKPVICKFDPPIPGPFSAYFYFQANQKLDSILLTGIGAVAKAIFTPPVLNYGIVPSNHPDTLFTILRDSGDYELHITDIKIVGPDAADFYIVKTIPKFNPIDTLLPDSTITISVGFKTNALTGKVHSASLCVYYDDGTSDCRPLEAIEEAQYLQFGSSSIDFGKHRIKTLSRGYGVFHNGSNISLQIGAASITPVGGVFSLLYDTLNPVNAKSQDSLEVDFFPQVRGMYVGYLHAFGKDIKTDSIQLRGQGAAPIPIFSRDTINFGLVTLNMLSQPEPLTLYNTGDWWLKAVTIEIVGDPNNEFSFKKLEGTTQSFVNSDSICEQQKSDYVVTFTPKQTIVYHGAKLVFTFDDGTTGSVQLIGYDESPTMVLDADTIDFGKVRIGTTPGLFTLHIICTAQKNLTAQSVTLETSAPAGTYNFSDANTPASGPISIPSRSIYPVDVTFTPQSIGVFGAHLIFKGSDFKKTPDTVFITGLGAKPDSLFSSNNLDFGSHFPGYSDTRSFTIKNNGNWIFSANEKITGANAADFTLRNIQPQYNIAQDSIQTFTVDFLSTTPYQAAPRTAQLVFTLDDSSVITVEMTEQDIAPLPVDLRVDNSHIRLGDYTVPCLRMRNDIPDSLHVLDIKGLITYDPNVVDLDRTAVQLGDGLVQLGSWALMANAADIPGQITYELKGTVTPLSKAGALLRLKFTPHAGVKPGASSPLKHTQFSFPLHYELDALVDTGYIIIDSACGETHLVSGQATANMVDHNMPNPFGKNSSGTTQIPFDIGYDNTPVTIRILDISGHEVARPLDNVIFNQGRYQTTVSAASLGATGTYFYEFRAGDAQPVFMKMVVNK